MREIFWELQDIAKLPLSGPDQTMKRRGVFLDLNGTLVVPIIVQHLGELRLVGDAGSAVASLSKAGFVCPVVTIQSRIGKGLFSLEEFQKWFESFAAQLRDHGAEVVGPYVCPHRFAEACHCKKPGTFLYAQAATEHGIDLRRSFVIGDSAADVEAAGRFGGRSVLVRTGWAADEQEAKRGTPFASYVTQSLTDATAWVLRQPEQAV
jgi:D-glycero-D-manno-heptose 1,7-bisphosphate phosphatase